VGRPLGPFGQAVRALPVGWAAGPCAPLRAKIKERRNFIFQKQYLYEFDEYLNEFE
jgi:hypothetical protein